MLTIKSNSGSLRKESRRNPTYFVRSFANEAISQNPFSKSKSTSPDGPEVRPDSGVAPLPHDKHASNNSRHFRHVGNPRPATNNLFQTTTCW